MVLLIFDFAGLVVRVHHVVHTPSFKLLTFFTFIPISGQQQLGAYLAPFQGYGSLNVENRQFSLPHSYFG